MRCELVIALIGLGLVSCKDKPRAQRVDVDPVAPDPASPQRSKTELRTQGTLAVAETDGTFVVTDGAGQMKIVLPNRPTLSGDVIEQGGVEVFNAQAVMPGGDVDAQVGVMTVRDGVVPPELEDMLTAAPNDLATASGGKVAKNEAGTLAGRAARVFELTMPDGRRLFGWYMAAAGHGRVYQVNCVGVDTPTSRTACEAIAASLTLR